MTNQRLGVALIGDTVLNRNFPPWMLAHATSLSLELSGRKNVHEFAALIGACTNVRNLVIFAPGTSKLTSCVPRRLEALSSLHLYADIQVSADEVTNLMCFLPNVRRITRLPVTLNPLGGDSRPVGPVSLDYLAVNWGSGTTILFVQMITHRWRVRQLDLYAAPFMLELLARTNLGVGELPSTQALSFNIQDSVTDYTTLLHSLIAACHLRFLAIRISLVKTIEGLAVALGACVSLRRLSVAFDYFEHARDVQAAVDTLIGAMPRALRSLEVRTLPLYLPVFQALRPVCRSRRILLDISSAR